MDDDLKKDFEELANKILDKYPIVLGYKIKQDEPPKDHPSGIVTIYYKIPVKDEQEEIT